MKKLILLLAFTVGFTNLAFAQAPADKAKASGPAKAEGLFKDVEVDEAERLLKENKTIIVLDVRTDKEYTAGHIAGAKNVDFYDKDFAKKLETLDKSQTYLVHCAAGGRSAKTRDLMSKLHFKTIYHLKPGFNGWVSAGKPVEK